MWFVKGSVLGVHDPARGWVLVGRSSNSLMIAGADFRNLCPLRRNIQNLS